MQVPASLKSIVAWKCRRFGQPRLLLIKQCAWSRKRDRWSSAKMTISMGTSHCSRSLAPSAAFFKFQEFCATDKLFWLLRGYDFVIQVSVCTFIKEKKKPFRKFKYWFISDTDVSFLLSWQKIRFIYLSVLFFLLCNFYSLILIRI